MPASEPGLPARRETDFAFATRRWPQRDLAFLNRVMRVLAVVSVLGPIPAVIGGLFGMNLFATPWPYTLPQVAFAVVFGGVLCLYLCSVQGWLRRKRRSIAPDHLFRCRQRTQGLAELPQREDEQQAQKRLNAGAKNATCQEQYPAQIGGWGQSEGKVMSVPPERVAG